MKLSAFILLLFTSFSWGQAAYDYRLQQQNSTGTGPVTQFFSPPAGGANGIFTLIGNSSGAATPMLSTFNTGLVFDSVNKTVSVSGPHTIITDWGTQIASDLAPYALTATMNSGLAGKMDVPAFSSTLYLRGNNTWATFPTDLTSFTNTPGYITNSTSGLTNYTTTTNLNSALNGKFNTPSGTTSQYIRGDGSLQTFPSIPNSATAPITLTSGVIAINAATTTDAGSLSAADKTKIDAITPPSSWTYTTPTFSSSTTATQLSPTRPAFVKYSYDATVTISLLAGQSVTAVLKYADNSGMSTNVVIVDSSKVANSGVLNLTQTNTLQISGIVPPGKYRQVTFTTAGSGVTAPSAIAAGQEVIQ